MLSSNICCRVVPARRSARRRSPPFLPGGPRQAPVPSRPWYPRTRARRRHHTGEQVVNRGDAGLAALCHDVGGAEFTCDRLPVGMARHCDDALGPEASSGQHRAQADRAVADHDHGAAGPDLSRDGCVVAGSHHVGQREQAVYERVVRCLRRRYQGAVGHGYPHPLALASVDRKTVFILAAPPGAMLARGVHPVTAVDARPVADRERRDDEPAADGSDVGAGSSTVPTNSCPIRVADFVAVMPRYGHRSEPQTQEATTRTSTSVGRRISGSGTSSTRMSRGP